MAADAISASAAQQSFARVHGARVHGAPVVDRFNVKSPMPLIEASTHIMLCTVLSPW